jgi:tetratricopeptide (TPR) repeat protein
VTGAVWLRKGSKVLEVLVSFSYYIVNSRVELSPARRLIPQQPPPNPKTLFEEAQRALIAHDYAKAERGFRGVKKIDPRSVAAYSKLGVVNMRLDRYDLAIKAFKEAEKLAPDVTGLDLDPGDCKRWLGRNSKALSPESCLLQKFPARNRKRA